MKYCCKEMKEDIIKSNKELLEKCEKELVEDNSTMANTKRLELVGKIKVMNCGEEVEIIKYYNASNILVRFNESGEVVKSTYGNFKRGTIKSHFNISVYNVGVIGNKLNWDKDSCKRWRGILERCYNSKFLIKNPTYIGCSVCNEWLYYPNFKKWYDENYYTIKNQRMELDKDILFKGNKIYNPNSCIFVPERINTLFTKSNKSRGELPIGLRYSKNFKRIEVSVHINKTQKHLGYFPNNSNGIQEAFGVYKQAKEREIKRVADEYKDKIPKKLYDGMCNYKIEIDD